MRRRSAGARAGNALAARGQLAGSIAGSAGQRFALARSNQEIARPGFCEFLPSQPPSRRYHPRIRYSSTPLRRWPERRRGAPLDFGGRQWHWLPYWHAPTPRKHPPRHSSTHS